MADQNLSGADVSFFHRVGETPAKRLGYILDTMRELSQQNDPQQMVATYSRRMRDVIPSDRFVSLSRRELDRPFVRVTRSNLWEHQPNPWRETSLLPVYASGALSDFIWSDTATVIDDLAGLIAPDDPTASYFEGMRSLVALPLFDRGVALNMVVLMKKEPGYFDPQHLGEHVWMSNLFGRATQNLVLNEQLQRAYELIDRELKVVADIQRSLLPQELPHVPTLQLAASYQTSQRAGGDYYDFFPLPGGKWGLLIADVSGHGTPAAVLMAVTHSIAHAWDEPPRSPAAMMKFINGHLCARYTNGNGTFVTAFYGIYDPATRTLNSCSAGHCPPRRHRAGGGDVINLCFSGHLPLGIDPDEVFDETECRLEVGDTIVFYTDGLTEARNADNDLLGTERLDRIIERCADCDTTELVDQILSATDEFTGNRPLTDDRTLVVARVV